MAFEQYIKGKKAFVFELDNVLYPGKDYLLQVYYLFAQFIEYGEQIPAAEIVKYMEQTFIEEGEVDLFEKTSKQFNIPGQYFVNFDLLMHSAKLPLKLLMFQEVLSFLQEIVLERREIFLFTDGNPAMQLNKIRQLEWQGLEKYLKVYFSAETEAKPSAIGLESILNVHGFNKEEVLFVGKSEIDEIAASNAGIDFLNVDKLLLP